jgi:hypothetical protein
LIWVVGPFGWFEKRPLYKGFLHSWVVGWGTRMKSGAMLSD